MECWWSRSRQKRGKPIALPIERNVQQCTPGVETRAASPKRGACPVPRSCWPHGWRGLNIRASPGCFGLAGRKAGRSGASGPCWPQGWRDPVLKQRAGRKAGGLPMPGLSCFGIQSCWQHVAGNGRASGIGDNEVIRTRTPDGPFTMAGIKNDPLPDKESTREQTVSAGNRSAAAMAETGGGIGIPVPCAPGAGGRPTRVAFARDYSVPCPCRRCLSTTRSNRARDSWQGGDRKSVV